MWHLLHPWWNVEGPVFRRYPFLVCAQDSSILVPCFLGSILSIFWLIVFLSSLLQCSVCLDRGEGAGIDVPFKAECLTVTSSQHFVHI